MMLNLRRGRFNTLHLVNVTSILMEVHMPWNVKELLVFGKGLHNLWYKWLGTVRPIYCLYKISKTNARLKTRLWDMCKKEWGNMS
jgi:hypothetical protein